MPERLTDARIEELLALEAKAPEETWSYQEKSDAYTHIIRLPNNEYICGFGQNSDGKAESRARLSIASRNSIRSLLEEVRERRAVEKSCTKPVTPNDHLDLIYETAIARAEEEGTNR